nr:hypothetical protein [Archaeoglobus neptunius]
MDVSNPTNPEKLGEIHLNELARNLVAYENYVYVAGSKLWIVDVSNPAEPRVINEFPLKNIATVYISDGYLYVGVSCLIGSEYEIVKSAELTVYDLSDPANPREIGKYTASDFCCGSLYVEKGHVYAVWKKGLSVLDASDPASIREIWSSNTGGKKIMGTNGYVYVLSGSNITILDASEPDRIKKAGVYSNKFEDMYISGNYGYMVVLKNLEVLDLSKPADPVKVAEYTSTSRLVGVSASGEYAYVIGENIEVLKVNLSSQNQSSTLQSNFVEEMLKTVFKIFNLIKNLLGD